MTAPKKLKRFADKIWIGGRFLEGDVEGQDNVEVVPADLMDELAAKKDPRTEEQIILDGVTVLAKKKLAEIPLEDLLKRTSFLCPVCLHDGRTQTFNSRTALLQHLSTVSSTSRTRLKMHHQGYANAFDEILASNIGGPSVAVPMEVDVGKRRAENVVWPPVLVTYVRNADHKHVLDDMLKKLGFASEVYTETLRLSFGRMYMVVFEASMEGHQHMSAVHDQLEKEGKGRRDWERAKGGTNREPLRRNWLFGYAAEQTDMEDLDAYHQMVEWSMVPYDKAVTKDSVTLKERRAKEKEDADLVMDELEEGARRIKEAEDWMMKAHLLAEKEAADIHAEYEFKVDAEDRALAVMEGRLQSIQDERWRTHGGQLKFTVVDEDHTLQNQDDENDVQHMEKELMEEEMRRIMSEKLEAAQRAREVLEAFDAEEEEETLKIQREHEEATRRAMEELRSREEECERQLRLEAEREAEEQQKELQKKLDVLEEKRDDLEYQESLSGALTTQQRAAVDRVKEFRDACIKVWLETAGKGLGDDKRENVFGQVYVKMVGSLEDARPVWQAACKKKFRDLSEDARNVEFISRFSAMEDDLLRDPKWYPFKIVNGKTEVDESDEKLVELERELGTEVKRSVMDALLLMDTYNASGRFPMPVFWHLSNKRPATWTEIMKGLTLLKAKKSKKGKK